MFIKVHKDLLFIFLFFLPFLLSGQEIDNSSTATETSNTSLEKIDEVEEVVLDSIPKVDSTLSSIHVDSLLYYFYRSPQKYQNGLLHYESSCATLDSIEQLIDITDFRFLQAWNYLWLHTQFSPNLSVVILKKYLQKFEAIEGFMETPSALAILHPFVDFYTQNPSSDDAVAPKLERYKEKIQELHKRSFIKCSRDPEPTYMIVEEMPHFSGCVDGKLSRQEKNDCARIKLMEFIYQQLYHPILARTHGIEGTAVISFTVSTCGKLKDIKLLRDPGGGCGKEAIRIINSMNYLSAPWIAGVQAGKEVAIRYNLPILFKLP